MVLESLMGGVDAEEKPYKVFLLGILYATVAIFLSLWIFRSESSLVLVFLTVLASLPLVYATLRLEANKTTKEKTELKLMKQHWSGIKLFIYLFMGYVIAMSVAYIILPTAVVGDLFSSQVATIQSINSDIANNGASGGLTSTDFFSIIVMNNFRVLFFCVFFSFFFGAGAIFILTWNASVIAAAVGSYVRNGIASYATVVGFTKIATYFQLFVLGTLRYMTHGIFEILAYFVGGLAGGLISLGILHYKVNDEKFRLLMKDSIDLILVAMLIVVIAGVIEVWVTPAIF
ncbi:hypothetical protein HOD38_05660 [archaeon]|jgi:uncharacterized membrane protein SpoIIM required for sporulation|nr:hypothetical protein [archaeon]MBT4397728.1 hypothetical protein [archaeon]MBT4441213.1 hypothetical protein [archaeon]